MLHLLDILLYVNVGNARIIAGNFDLLLVAASVVNRATNVSVVHGMRVHFHVTNMSFSVK